MNNDSGSTKNVTHAAASPEHQLEFDLPIGDANIPWDGGYFKCECGAEKLGVFKHSDYCPKYTKDEN